MPASCQLVYFVPADGPSPSNFLTKTVNFGGAVQVMKCRGASGSNAEYVTRLADFTRHHIPLDDDRELFELDALVRRLQTSHVDVNHPSSSHDATVSPDTTECQISTHRSVTVRAG